MSFIFRKQATVLYLALSKFFINLYNLASIIRYLDYKKLAVFTIDLCVSYSCKLKGTKIYDRSVLKVT